MIINKYYKLFKSNSLGSKQFDLSKITLRSEQTFLQ